MKLLPGTRERVEWVFRGQADGVPILAQINEHVVKRAVDQGLADAQVMAADITAQEAAIPYPNEMRLMATFVSAIAAGAKHVGAALKGFVAHAGELFQKAKRKLREFRLFGKNKAKAVRMQMTAQMADIVHGVQSKLGGALKHVVEGRLRLRRHRKAAWSRVNRLHRTMQTLLPQIRYWIRTGWVAANNIVNLQIPELYAIVRGKIGKEVEFGLNWAFAGCAADICSPRWRRTSASCTTRGTRRRPCASTSRPSERHRAAMPTIAEAGAAPMSPR